MRTLKLLIILNQDKPHLYTRGIVVQAMVLRHQKLQNLPAWRILKAGLSNYNEEAGEMSFSILARACLGDTQRNEVDHLNKLYRLLDVYSLVVSEVEEDVASKCNNTSWRKSVTPDSPEVLASVQFVLTRLRQVRDKQVRVYSDDGKSFKQREYADDHLQPLPADIYTLWRADCSDNVIACMNSAKKLWFDT